MTVAAYTHAPPNRLLKTSRLRRGNRRSPQFQQSRLTRTLIVVLTASLPATVLLATLPTSGDATMLLELASVAKLAGSGTVHLVGDLDAQRPLAVLLLT